MWHRSLYRDLVRHPRCGIGCHGNTLYEVKQSTLTFTTRFWFPRLTPEGSAFYQALCFSLKAVAATASLQLMVKDNISCGLEMMVEWGNLAEHSWARWSAVGRTELDVVTVRKIFITHPHDNYHTQLLWLCDNSLYILWLAAIWHLY